MKLRSDPPEGWRKAKCAGTVTNEYDPFFDDQDEAVQFCNGTVDGMVCPIRQECLEFALQNHEKFGVWGGTTELTRKGMRRKFPPPRDKTHHPGWRWMTEEQALEGLNRSELQRELDRDQNAAG